MSISKNTAAPYGAAGKTELLHLLHVLVRLTQAARTTISYCCIPDIMSDISWISMSDGISNALSGIVASKFTSVYSTVVVAPSGVVGSTFQRVSLVGSEPYLGSRALCRPRFEDGAFFS